MFDFFFGSGRAGNPMSLTSANQNVQWVLGKEEPVLWFSKCDLWSRGNGVTWELVRDADFSSST